MLPRKSLNMDSESGNQELGQHNPAYVHTEKDLAPTPIHLTSRLTSTRKVDPLGSEGREQWSNPIEFLLSCIAMSVGLGNIWRFPFTAYENGGGAFLIPYLVVLFLIGKPLYFLELSMGQFSSYGQVKVWKMVPLFKGVGYGSAFACFCVASYYCSLMAITVYYFFASFQSELPWTKCNENWEGYNCSENGYAFRTDSNFSEPVPLPELYFNKDVLNTKDNIDDGIGLPGWDLTLCLLFAWFCIFGALVKGVKSSGKVAYFTALFPYVVLLILLIRGLTLEGALDGIKYFIAPRWEKILEPKVWFAAVGQCFFSLSVGFGPIIMFASYNPFRHNVYRDAMIISLMDTFTSLLAGFTIFAILGNLAYEQNVDISKVTGGSTSLAFVSYPRAIATFNFVPQLFAVLFFLMLFTLGIGSATSLAGGLITIIQDRFPKLNKFRVTMAVCVVGFLSGLIYVTPGGQFMLVLVDHYGADFVIYSMATIEILAMSWVYGLSNLTRDVEFMIKKPLGFYWKICWGFIVPVTLLTILTYSLVTSQPLTYEGAEYPTLAITFGRILSAIPLAIVPLCGVHAILTRPGSGIFTKLKQSVEPTDDWGPQDPDNFKAWRQLPETSSWYSKSRLTGLLRKLARK